MLLPSPHGSPFASNGLPVFPSPTALICTVWSFLFLRDPDNPQERDILPSLKLGSQEDTLESYSFPKLALFLGVGAQQNYLGYVFVFLKPINPHKCRLLVNTTECASVSFRNLTFEGQGPHRRGLTVFLKPFNEIPPYVSDAIKIVNMYCLILVNSELILNLVQ